MKPIFSALLLVTSLALAGAVSVSAQAASGKAVEVTGKVTKVEDNGYPFFTVSLLTPTGNPALELGANAEELGLGGTLNSLNGKTVTAHYLDVNELALMDIQANGSSLLGSDAPKAEAGWAKATGVLSGAEAVTDSDLPGQITITTSKGQKLVFDFYVTPEMVPVNGKQVTALYEIRAVKILTDIKAK